MQLSLNGWPPVASHLGCLILGISAANLSTPPTPRRAELPPHSLTLTVAMPNTKGAPAVPAVGTQVYVVQAAAGGCRLNDHPFLLVQSGKTTALSLALKEAPNLATLAPLAHSLQQGALSLRDAASAAALPLCAKQPKVTYGES